MPDNKSFLSTPEGKFGAVGTTALIGAGGVAAYYLLPPIIVLLTNTLYAMALAGGVGLAAYTFINPRTRLLLSYLYRSFWRALTGLFITIDPIGIMEGYREDLSEKLDEMQKQIGVLRGQGEKIERFLAKKNEERDHAMRLVRQAKEAGNKGVLAVQGNQVSRLDKTIKNLTGMETRINTAMNSFNKMAEFAKLKFDDISMEIDNRKEERKMMKASYGAFNAAVKILKGDPAALALYNQTTEHLDDDFAAKMGEVGQFVEEMSGAIATMDLEKGGFAADALEKLDQWEVRSTELLSNSRSTESFSKDLGDGRRSSNINDLAENLNLADKEIEVRRNASRANGVKTLGSSEFSDLFKNR